MITLSGKHVKISRNIIRLVIEKNERIKITDNDEEIYLISKKDMRALKDLATIEAMMLNSKDIMAS